MRSSKLRIAEMSLSTRLKNLSGFAVLGVGLLSPASAPAAPECVGDACKSIRLITEGPCIGVLIGMWRPVKVSFLLADGPVSVTSADRGAEAAKVSSFNPIELEQCEMLLKIDGGPMTLRSNCARALQMEADRRLEPPIQRFAPIPHGATCVKPNEVQSVRATTLTVLAPCVGDACYSFEVLYEACRIRNTGNRPAKITLYTDLRNGVAGQFDPVQPGQTIYYGDRFGVCPFPGVLLEARFR